MKKLIPLIAGFILGFSNPATAETHQYREFNAGVSGLDPFGYHDIFPGTSYLRSTVHTNDRLFFESQFGIALPTIVTIKACAGLNYDKTRLSLAFRLWPATIGPQLEIIGEKRSIIMSYEVSLHSGPLMDNAHLVTFGVRWEPRVIRL
mgnify:FL=1